MAGNRLSQRNQLVVLAVLVLGLCGAWYFYMIRPLQAEVAKIKQDVTQLENEILASVVIREKLGEVKAAVQEQEAKLAHLRQVLPEKKETAEIIRQVQDSAVESGLRVTSFAPRPTVNNEFYEDWPIQLALEGNFNSLGLFFEKLSGFTRLINVGGLQMRAVEENANRNRTLVASCVATTFVYIEPPQAEAEVRR